MASLMELSRHQLKRSPSKLQWKEVMNPAFATWKAQEQQVRYLIISVSRDVLVQIAALPSTREVWKHIEMSFASQLRS
jgi:hypothetical protein